MDIPGSNPPRKGFRRVARRPKTRGERLRDPSAIILYESGHGETNANGCDDCDRLAGACDLDEENFAVSFGVDDELRRIYLYAERPETTGAVGVTRLKGIRSYAFSLAAAFEEAPSLRPATRISCGLVPGNDPEGNACLIIPFDSAQERPVRPANGRSAQK